MTHSMQNRLRGALGRNAWRTARAGCDDIFYSHLAQYSTFRTDDPAIVSWRVNQDSATDLQALFQWCPELVFMMLDAKEWIRGSG